MGMIRLSIIVPIYQVVDYLCKCVDNLLKQDFPSSDYEIILVDDGSLDECPNICDSYGKIYNNIRVIHRENGGLSAARNSGLEVAQGEYVMFVDSDDYIEPNVLSGLMRQVEGEQLDVLRFDYQNVKLKSEGVYEVFEPNKTPRYIDNEDEIVDGETYLNTRMGYACYAWQFVLRRDLIISNQRSEIKHQTLEKGDCLFTQGLHFEDVDWLPRMMLRAKRVNSTTMIVYNYLMRRGSITKTEGDKTKIRKNVEDCMTIIRRYRQYKEQHPDCKWLYNMQSSMAAGILTSIAKDLFANRMEYIEQLRKLNVFPLAIDNQGRTYERRARIINFLGPRIFCAIMHFRE